MTDGKMIAILEELRDDRIANMSNSNIAGEAEALSMATELLARGIDLATENEQLKAKLDATYAEVDKYKDLMESVKSQYQSELRNNSVLMTENNTLWKALKVVANG